MGFLKYLTPEGIKIDNRFFEFTTKKYYGFAKPVNDVDGFNSWQGMLVHKKPAASATGVSIYNKINTTVNLNIGITNRSFLNRLRKSRYIGINQEVINSEYEWYLQKSLLNRMYETYIKFSKLLRNNRVLITQKDIYLTSPAYEETRRLQGNVIVKNESVHSSESVTSRTVSEKSIRIDKKIETESVKSEPDIYNIIHNSISVDQIAAIVGRDIESKLRVERLKKGY